MKKLLIVLAVAFLAMLSVSAYAEVQNVKVGGDLTTYAVSRYSYNLGLATAGKSDNNGFISIARVKLDADLTDNVVATMRLLNERTWGALDESAQNTDIDLDVAYITLKEFMIPQATAMVGRFNLVLGSGLLVADADTNRLTSTAASSLPAGFGDLSARAAFDGAAVILDYNPLKYTIGYVKGSEGSFNVTGDDVNVYVGNIDYDTGTMGTVVSLYDVAEDAKKGEINNIGARVVSKPIENLNVNAEYCYQTTKRGARGENKDSSGDDSAILLGATYSMPKVSMSPSIGLDYTRLSRNWNVMFEGLTPADIMNSILPNTNAQIFGASVSAKPMDDLTLKLRLATAKVIDVGGSIPVWGATTGNYAMTDKKELGNEADLHVTYDYTEDVQFGLKLGIFNPGNAFAKSNNKNASQVLGSMKVTF